MASSTVALVPEERASQGLILDMQVEPNIALAKLSRALLEDEYAIATPYMQQFGIRGGGTARTLSGGNRQKVVLSKWMAISPTILLLDEPTRGLDIGAKRDVHDVVRALAAQGASVMQITFNAVNLVGHSLWQNIVAGSVILAAVVVDRLFEKRTL